MKTLFAVIAILSIAFSVLIFLTGNYPASTYLVLFAIFFAISAHE